MRIGWRFLQVLRFCSVSALGALGLAEYHPLRIVPCPVLAYPPEIPMFTRFSPDCLRDVDARRICIIKPSALGDVVQTMPLLPALNRRFPTAEVAWVVNRELSELLEGQPELTEIISFDRHGSWRDALSLLATLRRRRFDLVFDLQGLLRTGLMTAATGAKLRVGLETAREGANLACHGLIPRTGRNVPAYARYWRVAEALGVTEPAGRICIPQNDAELSWSRERLQRLARPLVAIHPGARWETKRWPTDKFAHVAAQTAQEFGASIVVVGSRTETPLANAIVEKLTARGSPAVNLAGATTLRQLASVLRSVDLVVSNDSGPMHLAAGLGTPVVGVFTCTSPFLSGPEVGRPGSPRHELLTTRVPCAGSYCKVCPQPAGGFLACLQELSTGRVWEAICRSLDQWQRPAQSA